MKPIDLTEHPEGGRFREVYRSPIWVMTATGSERSAVTHIYFSLEGHEVSRFHKVDSDEVWNLYRGEGLRLYLWHEETGAAQVVELSARVNAFCHVVPADTWQAAAPLSGPVLVGCTVAPGFEFADFHLMEKDSKTARRLAADHPDWKALMPGA